MEKGWTLERLAQSPGFPCALTVYRWARADPAFAARLREARAWRAGLWGEQRKGPSFNPAQAEAFLQQVRSGARVHELVKLPAWPHAAKLARWKRERPEFAAELAEAVRRRPPRTRRIGFDQETADSIILQVAAGAPLPRVLAARSRPSKSIVRRWALERPDFGGALAIAKLAGHRVRMRARSRRSEALEDEILSRLCAGAALREICRLRHMPHWSTLHAWMARDPGFAQMVGWARCDGQDALADQACAIVEANSGADGLAAARRLLGRAARMAPGG